MSLPPRILVETFDTPNLRNPSLICGFLGSGLVGKLAVDHLIEELKAIPFANMFSSSFPPQVSIQPDGTIDLMKNILYYYKGDRDDLILLSGDAQPVTPESEYDMAEYIVNISATLNVKTIYTLGAFITGTFPKNPKVFGTSTVEKIVQEFQKYNISTMSNGTITGMNGLVIGVGKRKQIPGICLLGETSGYVVDAKASKAVLEALMRMLDLRLGLTGISKKVQETAYLVKTIEEQISYGRESLSMHQHDKKLGYIS